MRDLLSDIAAWRAQGAPVAVATVTRTWGSAPRREGAKMAIAPGDRLSGSVSGGCVEGAVVEAALETIGTGRPQALRFGVADATAWEVGLACGGTVEVFVEALGPETFEAWQAAVSGRRALASAMVIAGAPLLGARTFMDDGGAMWGVEGPPALRDALAAALRSGRPARFAAGGADYFIDVTAPPWELICIGAAHIAIPLSKIARVLGYRVTVIDPRAAFATPIRFPDVDALIVDWPGRALPGLAVPPTAAIAALTHDPKIDDPALEVALASRAFYIGALGSRRTHAARLERLRLRGIPEDALARIHGPIGLELGARDPAEIALAIMGQIVAERNGVGAAARAAVDQVE